MPHTLLFRRSWSFIALRNAGIEKHTHGGNASVRKVGVAIAIGRAAATELGNGPRIGCRAAPAALGSTPTAETAEA